MFGGDVSVIQWKNGEIKRKLMESPDLRSWTKLMRVN